MTINSFSQTVTIKYKVNTVVFDTVHHIPFYCYYVFTKRQSDSLGKFKRLLTFSDDTNVKYIQATNKNYYDINRGKNKNKLLTYDRGHMSPADDFSYDKIAEEQCFLFTNIVPQNSTNNEVQWRKLENHVREEVKNMDSLLIITGAFCFQKKSMMDNIAIPDSLFKVIYCLKNKTTETYVVPNVNINDYTQFLHKTAIVNNVDFNKIIEKILSNK